MSSASTGRELVVAMGETSLGVDIESASRLTEIAAEEFAGTVPTWAQVARACEPRSSATELWTALEALGKATGRGILASAAELEHATSTHRLAWFHDGDYTVCVASGATSDVRRVDFDVAA